MTVLSGKKFSLSRYARWTLLSVLSGILAGTAAAIFLHLLRLATDFRTIHPAIIWGLPVAGFLIEWVYFRHGGNVAAGSNLILDEIHDPKKTIPLRMSPFILLGTVITHLFGGSAGREGTVVQMGAALSDRISKLFKVENQERKILLVAGAGAGFGAAIGAPLAGIIFGMEVISVGRLKIFAWFECLVASFVAYGTVLLFQVQHSRFPSVGTLQFNAGTFMWVALAGVIFGLVSRPFVWLTHGIERFHLRFLKFPPLRPLVAGLVLCAIYYWDATYRYAGLGIPYIQQALEQPTSFRDPLMKTLVTAITVGSTFKGGEFIPLVFIGTTLGSAMSAFIPLSFSLLGALGFAAVFAGAANTPVACALMAAEVFGWNLFPYALVACFAAYYFSGHRGIYKTQRILNRKIGVPSRKNRPIDS